VAELPERIGFIGLGAMGMPMARRLAAAGHRLLVYDRDPALSEQAGGRDGVEAADGAGAVAAACELLLTCLPNPGAVEAVYEEIVAVCATSGRRLRAADCSTIGPGLAIRLQRRLAAGGVRYVECPMLGGVDEAASGQLFFIVSGAEGDVAPLLPRFALLGRGHRVVGGPGDASRFKVVQNGLGLVQLAAIAEALAILAKAGADLGAFCEVVAAGHGMADTPLFRAKAPLMLAAEAEAKGRLRIGAKDIGLAAALARELGLAAPLFERAEALFAEAIAQGLGEADIAAVARALEARSGVRIGR
jgi:3-hydroxyisobutyrate dehydrogenase-like beta-hydroxyacid dehydrogenase